jgi:hypothetical protein
MDSSLTQPLSNPFDDRLGNVAWGGIRPRRTTAFSRAPVKSELANQQHWRARIFNASFPVENSELSDFADHRFPSLIGILSPDTNKSE